MAVKKKDAEPRSTGTALVNYEEELARQAQQYAQQEESSGGGQFFSVKGGVLTYAGAAMPNNQVAVIVADAVLENVFYEGDFDPDDPQQPACYAFGRDEKEMTPHQIVVGAGNHQHSTCAGCSRNEWGSADKGRGKACKNSRRLVLLPAGQLDDRGRYTAPSDAAEYFASAGFGFFRLPVTSVKGYANFVKQVAGALRLPPHGIVTRIRVVPDASTQFKVLFEPIQPLEKELIPVVMRRHEGARSIIETPYPAPEPSTTTSKGHGKAAPAKGRGRR